MSRFALPRGPSAGFPVSNAYASRRERGQPRARTNTSDKKHYAGSAAGIGRPFGGGAGPRGPAGAFRGVAPVRLPNRGTTGRTPGLMTRIVARARARLGL